MAGALLCEDAVIPATQKQNFTMPSFTMNQLGTQAFDKAVANFSCNTKL